MGLIRTEIDLSNPRSGELAPLKVRALVDTGAVTLCVPEHVAVQLDLAELEKREVTVNPESPNIPSAVVKAARPVSQLSVASRALRSLDAH